MSTNSHIFLGRTEEQEQFRQVLRSLQKNWLQKFSQLLLTPIPPPKRANNGIPFVFLFYNEGGMGKTTLVQRLQEISETPPFDGKFNTLFLDWENKRKHYRDLQVGHDNIQPETVLRVVYDEFKNRTWHDYFNEYQKVVKTLKETEANIDQKLKSEPDNEAYAQLRELGAKGVTALIRRNQPDVARLISSDSLEQGIGAIMQVGGEKLTQIRELMREALTHEKLEIYERPHEHLAEALGSGIAELAQQKQLVIFMDTYEIVDLPECDYVLRKAIQRSGERVVWVIAGRTNLADSARSVDDYFQGYRHEFPETHLYAKSLSEFGSREIQDYFSEAVPERPLSSADAKAIAKFSLGIPFVVSEAAAMWRERALLEEIIAPVPNILGQKTAHERVVTAMSERFLKHCFGADERKFDLCAIYALTMMRRPEPELLRSMLNITNLEHELQSLRQRYSFIWVEQVRLDDKLAAFLHEYLLAPLRRTSPQVKDLNQRAIQFLRQRLDALTKGLVSIEERIGEERVAETISDLVHHLFWMSEDERWRYFIPRFVEGLQYDRAWARSLLEIADSFCVTFSKDEQRRLKILSNGLYIFADTEGKRRMLDEIEILAQRQWLDGEGAEERSAILLLQRGHLLHYQELYKDALQKYLEAVEHLPRGTTQVRQDLAEALQVVGWKLGGEEKGSIKLSCAAFEQALELTPENATAWRGLGLKQKLLGQQEKALKSLNQAVALGKDYAAALNDLGELYEEMDLEEEAITVYKKAIECNQKNASSAACNRLGKIYNRQGKYDNAMAVYNQAIRLNSRNVHVFYNSIGSVYSEQGKYDAAINAYQQAIELEPENTYAHNGLGNIYRWQGNHNAAISTYEKVIEIDPKNAYANNGIGNVYRQQANYGSAIANYEKAIKQKPEWATPHKNLGKVYIRLNQINKAEVEFREASNLVCERHDIIFNLGLVCALQGHTNEAYAFWKKSLVLCGNTGLSNQLNHALYTITAGDTECGIMEMRNILDETKLPVGLLQSVLEDAEILARCPVKPAEIETIVEMLKNATN